MPRKQARRALNKPRRFANLPAGQDLQPARQPPSPREMPLLPGRRQGHLPDPCGTSSLGEELPRGELRRCPEPPRRCPRLAETRWILTGRVQPVSSLRRRLSRSPREQPRRARPSLGRGHRESGQILLRARSPQPASPAQQYRYLVYFKD